MDKIQLSISVLFSVSIRCHDFRLLFLTVDYHSSFLRVGLQRQTILMHILKIIRNLEWKRFTS